MLIIVMAAGDTATCNASGMHFAVVGQSFSFGTSHWSFMVIEDNFANEMICLLGASA